jgi:hypothetical protein
MPILSRCSEVGCRTLTIGDVCLRHDRRPLRAFVRGRPFVPPVLSEVLSTVPLATRTPVAVVATRSFD